MYLSVCRICVKYFSKQTKTQCHCTLYRLKHQFHLLIQGILQRSIASHKAFNIVSLNFIYNSQPHGHNQTVLIPNRIQYLCMCLELTRQSSYSRYLDSPLLRSLSNPNSTTTVLSYYSLPLSQFITKYPNNFFN